MRTSIVIFSPFLGRLAALALRLKSPECATTLVHTDRPLDEARTCELRPDVMLVDLRGVEHIAAVRGLLEEFPTTRILFALPDMPPSAAMARVVGKHGGALLGVDDDVVLTTAMLVAMGAQRRGVAAHAG